MKKKYVLDAGVLALYFAGRKDVRKFVDAAYSGNAEVYMCEVNLAEFLYNYARVFGWEAALVKNALVRNSPITIIGVDESLTLEAARIKLKHYSILSLADSYLIATARRLKATIITTDQSVYNVARTRAILLHI